MGTYNFRVVMSVKCPWCGNTIEQSKTKTPMQISSLTHPMHEMDCDIDEVSTQIHCQIWNHMTACPERVEAVR